MACGDIATLLLRAKRLEGWSDDVMYVPPMGCGYRLGSDKDQKMRWIRKYFDTGSRYKDPQAPEIGGNVEQGKKIEPPRKAIIYLVSEPWACVGQTRPAHRLFHGVLRGRVCCTLLGPPFCLGSLRRQRRNRAEQAKGQRQNHMLNSPVHAPQTSTWAQRPVILAILSDPPIACSLPRQKSRRLGVTRAKRSCRATLELVARILEPKYSHGCVSKISRRTMTHIIVDS